MAGLTVCGENLPRRMLGPGWHSWCLIMVSDISLEEKIGDILYNVPPDCSCMNMVCAETYGRRKEKIITSGNLIIDLDFLHLLYRKSQHNHTIQAKGRCLINIRILF